MSLCAHTHTHPVSTASLVNSSEWLWIYWEDYAQPMLGFLWSPLRTCNILHSWYYGLVGRADRVSELCSLSLSGRSDTHNGACGEGMNEGLLVVGNEWIRSLHLLKCLRMSIIFFTPILIRAEEQSSKTLILSSLSINSTSFHFL